MFVCNPGGPNNLLMVLLRSNTDEASTARAQKPSTDIPILKSLKQTKQMNKQLRISLLHESARCNLQEVTQLFGFLRHRSLQHGNELQQYIAHSTTGVYSITYIQERLCDKHASCLWV